MRKNFLGLFVALVFIIFLAGCEEEPSSSADTRPVNPSRVDNTDTDTTTSTPSTPDEVSCNSGVNVTFVIDATLSMGSTITGIKDEIASFASNLNNVSSTWSINIIGFGDAIVDDPWYKLEISSNSVSDIQSALTNMTMYGGGDLPESLYEGIHKALTDTIQPVAISAAQFLVAATDAETLSFASDDEISDLVNTNVRKMYFFSTLAKSNYPEFDQITDSKYSYTQSLTMSSGLDSAITDIQSICD